MNQSPMGMVKCPKHDLSHITSCCHEIADAVDEGLYQKANVRTDKRGRGSVLCDKHRGDLLRMIAGALQWGWPDLVFDPPLTARCEFDVDEWLMHAGHGTFCELERATNRSP